LRSEWHPDERKRWFERNLPRMLRQCVHFLTDSEAVRAELSGALGIPRERVTCTPLGVRPWLHPLAPAEIEPVRIALGLPPRYLLYVGTIEPRKNVLTLLRAYCDLPGALRDAYPLVLAGGWGWKADDVASYYHQTAHDKNVLHLGYVPEVALGALYNGARALVFPSLYEGFGLPPLEMLACGGAVLASTAASVQEVVGGRACLIDPYDVAGWRTALARIMLDDDWCEQLRCGAVEHARPFTWERCAASTLRVYRHIAAGHYDCGSPDPATQAA
jgi:alpha-1,3-rhamnosyl/mannosyltransferase